MASESWSKSVPISNEVQALELAANVAEELQKMIDAGHIALEDLDERALCAVNELNPLDAKTVLQQFSLCSLDHVSNKSAFLCSQIKTFKLRLDKGGVFEAFAAGPDRDRLRQLLERTGYSMEISAGQRKYGGPPPNWEGPQPGPGCEVFVGRIPKDLFEADLVPLMETCGRIWDLRIMIDQETALPKGFGFVTFTDQAGAKKATKTLDGYEIRSNKKLKVNISIANVRLFVANIPKTMTPNSLKEEFSKYTEGVKGVIVYKMPDDPSKKNRGFCFVEYDTHKSASNAKRRLQSGRVRPFNSDVVVDWADLQEEPDAEVMAKVKVLYVSYLTVDITEEELRILFQRHGQVERVRKLRDYAFVHFSQRAEAEQAIAALHGSNLGGNKIGVTLAKPRTESRRKEQRRIGRHMRQGFQNSTIQGRSLAPHQRSSMNNLRGRPASLMSFKYKDMEETSYDKYGGSFCDVNSLDSYHQVSGPKMTNPGRRGRSGWRMAAAEDYCCESVRTGNDFSVLEKYQNGHGITGLKRKIDTTDNSGCKRSSALTSSGSSGTWDMQPIVQQPLSRMSDTHNSSTQFYDDDFDLVW